MKQTTKRAILSAVGLILSAGNALAASAGQTMVQNGVTYNLGSMFGKLVSGVDAQFQEPLTWIYGNLASLVLAVPILVVLIIVITKSGIFGGHGRDASQVAQAEQQITHVLKTLITGVVVCGIIYIVGTKFIL